MESLPGLEKGTLIEKYFGDYLRRLLTAAKQTEYGGRFYLAAYITETLENRLMRIEGLDLTQSILNEVGEIDDAEELDKRLMDAWAEIRVLDQLNIEGFTNIQKVKEVADFTAECNVSSYAFQVKRIRSVLKSHISRLNDPKRRDPSPYGTLDDIYSRFQRPVGHYFWNALIEKNSKFRSWSEKDLVRCIMIVSSDEDLQDSLIRHIACQQIRTGIHDRSLGQLNFEELVWLPDLSPGAWFKVGSSPEKTRCFADWKDVIGDPGWNEELTVNRREVDLNSSINRWKEPTLFHKICS
jgi:hypothetical protein